MEITLTVISSSIVVFLALYIAFIIFNKPIILNYLKLALSVIILIAIVTVNYLIFSNFIKVFINFITLALICKYLFKDSLINCFFISAITTVYLFTAEVIYSLLLVVLTYLNIISLNYTWIGVFSSSVFVCIIAFGLLQLNFLTSFFISLKKHKKAKYNETIIIIMLTIGVLANKNVKLLGPNVEYIMNLFLIIIFSIIFFYLLKERESRIQLSLKYEQLFNCVHKYEKELTNKNMVIHEFKNQLIAIKGLNNGGNVELAKYLDSIISDFKNSKLKTLENMEHIPKGGLKGLIYYKLGDLEEEKINVLINVSPTIKKNIFSKMNSDLYKDIIKVIGVYLDNAVEAAKECSIRQITLEMYFRKKQFHFVLSNTYKDKINTKRINEVGYSTKGKGRGYGLSIVNKIISKYNFMDQEIDIIDNYFINHLSINLKNIPI